MHVLINDFRQSYYTQIVDVSDIYFHCQSFRIVLLSSNSLTSLFGMRINDDRRSQAGAPHTCHQRPWSSFSFQTFVISQILISVTVLNLLHSRIDDRHRVSVLVDINKLFGKLVVNHFKLVELLIAFTLTPRIISI